MTLDSNIYRYNRYISLELLVNFFGCNIYLFIQLNLYLTVTPVGGHLY